MGKRLLIIGAGGFGREILGWAEQIAAAGADWQIGGFLDADPNALDGFPSSVGIIGDPATYLPKAHDLFVCAVGDTSTKLSLCRAIQQRGGQFATLIHPTVVIGPHCRIGIGSILCPYASITTNVTLGDFVTLNTYAAVGHDSVVGDGCTLNGRASVNGNAVLGEGVYLAGHAVINLKAKVGDYAVVGSGSVVLLKVPPHTTVMGVPAKRIWTAPESKKAA